MDLQQVVISPAEAEDKLAEYTKRIGVERTAEDAAIAQAYRAAARGLGVIELPRTIAAGGWFESGLPQPDYNQIRQLERTERKTRPAAVELTDSDAITEGQP